MSEESNNKHHHNFFLVILFIGSIITIIDSFVFFYYGKKFNFIVETSCDKSKETCFYRDCSIEGYCPPNNLSYYKTFIIEADDFNKCQNEDCTDFCQREMIKCEQVSCTEDDLQNGTCTPVEIN